MDKPEIDGWTKEVGKGQQKDKQLIKSWKS